MLLVKNKNNFSLKLCILLKKLKLKLNIFIVKFTHENRAVKKCLKVSIQPMEPFSNLHSHYVWDKIHKRAK